MSEFPSHPPFLPSFPEVFFLDRDGVINEEPGPILTPEQLVFIPGSLAAIREINRLGKWCFVVTNQSAFARGWLNQEVFEAITLKLKMALREIGGHIDDQFYCPHYPQWEAGRVRELCIPCQCRKPGTLLFEQARQKYKLDWDQALFIGDSTTDFEAARRLGMASIGVKTGHGGQDGKCSAEPTLWAKDLQDAIHQVKSHYLTD